VNNNTQAIIAQLNIFFYLSFIRKDIMENHKVNGFGDENYLIKSRNLERQLNTEKMGTE
jgi:hypothetical protein